MRIFFAVIGGIIFFSVPVLAQEDYIGEATSSLQDVLSTLKQSVEKLSLDNDHLAARDNAMKEQVSELQGQLERLEAQGDSLDKSAAQLQDKNPRRSEEIERLEKENSDLDGRTQNAQHEIGMIQQSLDEGAQENQKLVNRLNGIASTPPPPPSPSSVAEARREKEKLRVMKMIYDSQQRQIVLHEAIAQFQKNRPVEPAPAAVRQQAPIHGDDGQLHQLEEELQSMERNYAQLKDLIAQMGKKSKGERLTVGQHVEEDKLQSSMNDFKHQGIELRGDLDDLRSQMVDLDKRKSRLETMVQQLP